MAGLTSGDTGSHGTLVRAWLLWVPSRTWALEHIRVRLGKSPGLGPGPTAPGLVRDAAQESVFLSSLADASRQKTSGYTCSF